MKDMLGRTMQAPLTPEQLAGARSVAGDPTWHPGLGTGKDWEKTYRRMVELLLDHIALLEEKLSDTWGKP